MKLDVKFLSTIDGEEVKIDSLSELTEDLKIIICNDYGEFIEKLVLNKIEANLLFMPKKNDK